LLESSGAPVDGEHAIGIRLVADDGTVLWTDTVTTTLNAGYYHLVLGAQAPLDGELFRGGTPRLELSVDGGAPISASGPIAHVPYAAVADHARLAERATAADRADTADHADSADHAASADEATTASHAISAARATDAEHAITAGQAERATTAAEADLAAHAATADRATVAEQLEADELELTLLTSATIHGGASSFDTVLAGRVDADTVAGDHLQSTTALIGTVQAGRVNAVVALGAGSGLVCDAGNRGVLRYPPGGPLQICQTTGWTEVGASEGAGTCSIVGECPDGGEPSRVWFDQLALVSPEAVDHLCSRYDRVLGGLRITGTFGDAAATQSAVIPCVDGVVADIISHATLGTIMPLVDNVTYDLQVKSLMEFSELQRIGRHLTATDTSPQSTLPALMIPHISTPCPERRPG
jgi:hypothetical protein